MRLCVNRTHYGVKGFELHTCIRSKYFPVSTHVVDNLSVVSTLSTALID